jgi:hypothetical protein
MRSSHPLREFVVGSCCKSLQVDAWRRSPARRIINSMEQATAEQGERVVQQPLEQISLPLVAHTEQAAAN